jgi:dTDP-4-amino-4,6-dideoxygalactose transaminase
MSDRIHLSKPDVTEHEERLVIEALRSGWVAPLGPMVDRFESEVAQRVGVAGALALSSGTAALHLALLDVGAGPGRVVVVPTMTFAASANAVIYTGAEPVFVDADPRDGNVDPGVLVDAVDTLRREGVDIAGVMTVDLFGRCADYANVAPALADRGIALIEDAAEALGARQDGRAAGSFGRAAALSFNGNKILTTSGGGMLLSDDLELLARARHLSTQARDAAPWYEHSEVGYNYRLSNLLAALGVAQLSRLDAMIARRREIRDRYAAALEAVPGMKVMGRSDGLDDSGDNHWLTCVTLPRGVSPHALVADLNAHDIEARHLWKPMHLQPVHQSRRAFITGASEGLFQHSVALPSGSALSDDEIDRVIAAVVASVDAAAPIAPSHA